MVLEFVQKTNIPVLTTMNGVDLAQDDMHIGFIGTHGNRVANMILNECDLIVSIGARLGIRQVGRDAKTFAPKADLVRCDIDANELSRDIKPGEKKFNTDVRDFMRMLMNEEVGDFTQWKSQCLKAKEMGLEVHCFAWPEGAVCREVVDYFHPVSIVEKDEIVRICSELNINGVVSNASELTAEIVAYVSEKLGLNGTPYSVLEQLHDKYFVRHLSERVVGLSKIKFYEYEGNDLNIDLSGDNMGILNYTTNDPKNQGGGTT